MSEVRFAVADADADADDDVRDQDFLPGRLELGHR